MTLMVGKHKSLPWLASQHWDCGGERVSVKQPVHLLLHLLLSVSFVVFVIQSFQLKSSLSSRISVLLLMHSIFWVFFILLVACVFQPKSGFGHLSLECQHQKATDRSWQQLFPNGPCKNPPRSIVSHESVKFRLLLLMLLLPDRRADIAKRSRRRRKTPDKSRTLLQTVQQPAAAKSTRST